MTQPFPASNVTSCAAQPLDSAASASFPDSCARTRSKMMASSSLVTPSSGLKFPSVPPNISRKPAIAQTASYAQCPRPTSRNALSDVSSLLASGLIIRYKISASSARVTCFSGLMLPSGKPCKYAP